MSIIARQIPDVKLIIAGRGEELQSYFPAGHDPRHYEILNDFIPVESVAGLFQRSAVTVLPYIESSQSGVAALSYGMGRPVVASNVNGLSEMVRHGSDGLLVPPQNVEALAKAIIDILSDPVRHAQMQAAAQRRAETDLNWDVIAGQTAELYQRVCNPDRQIIRSY